MAFGRPHRLRAIRPLTGIKTHPHIDPSCPAFPVLNIEHDDIAWLSLQQSEEFCPVQSRSSPRLLTHTAGLLG